MEGTHRGAYRVIYGSTCQNTYRKCIEGPMGVPVSSPTGGPIWGTHTQRVQGACLGPMGSPTMQAQELQRALMAAKARSRAAAEARAQQEREQRVLQGRLQHPWVPPHPTEATLRARCLHLQEMLQREAG